MSELFNRLRKVEQEKKAESPIVDPASAASSDIPLNPATDGFPIEGEIVRQREESRKRFKVGAITGGVIFLVAILSIGIIRGKSEINSKPSDSEINPPKLQGKIPEPTNTLVQSKAEPSVPSESKEPQDMVKTEEKGTDIAKSPGKKAKSAEVKTVEVAAPDAGVVENSKLNTKENDKPKPLVQRKPLIQLGNKIQAVGEKPQIDEKPQVKEQVPSPKAEPDMDANNTNFFEQGVNFYKGDNTAAAVESIKKGLRQNPQSAVGYNNLGVAYFRRGDLNESLSQFNMAVQLNPLYAEAHYNLAVTLEQLGRNQTALYHYLKFIELAPPQLKQLQENVKAHVDIY